MNASTSCAENECWLASVTMYPKSANASRGSPHLRVEHPLGVLAHLGHHLAWVGRDQLVGIRVEEHRIIRPHLPAEFGAEQLLLLPQRISDLRPRPHRPVSP
ncbi:hypothetical protein [Actinomadura sp. NPDC048394]|uniref:hypothetical protein n=1 Tax=Actinomadura sp. NPDC048394 TaxID=3158223 RepID=UPI003410670E